MKILFAGGGTAGHINPGIAIAKYLREKYQDASVVFVGTEKGLEKKLVPHEGFELRLIKVSGFKRKLSLHNVVALKELFSSLIAARKLIKEFKPDIVIGTGGYVCGPVLFIASQMKIPTLIHEQNAFPGVTNKILSHIVDTVAISFSESKKYFKSSKKLVVTGNPIRKELLLQKDKKKVRASKEKPILVIFGGSRGAEHINNAVCDMILNYYTGDECEIVFASGESQYDIVKEKLGDKNLNRPGLTILPYIFDMANVLAKADLAVCRAGAITISELGAMGVPSILIPSPYVTANHQEYNARAQEAHGSAVVIKEKDLTGSLLYNQVKSLLENSSHLSEMSKNAQKNSITDANERIYELVKELLI